ncbi:hypothetical protein NG791_28945 [Laspinema sp. D1]|uniref:hypothetical protein n=1 Tax=Laspinema palackyanum TaxID=3231601 RepID=UPI003482609A|nr:hypothetical protein [Laspinema sp. D2b]
MNSEDRERLKACHDEIAQILYRNSPPESLENLENIEEHLRQQWLEVMGPDIAFFLSKQQPGQKKDVSGP